jgi:hypothetical protein
MAPMRLRNVLVDALGHPVDAFDPARHPRRVNVGCGFDKRPGYLNVDLQAFHAPDVVADVRSIPQLPSGYYEEVIAQDVLEHLTRADGPTALAEWRRLLAPGGRIWLRIPDLRSLLRWIEESDDEERHRQVVHFTYGTQAYDGDYHLAGFTDVLVAVELERAGFDRITAELRDGWLWEVEAFVPAGAGRSCGVLWGAGFHAREGGAGQEHRWSEGRSELLLFAPEPTETELRLVIDAGAAVLVGAGARAELGKGEHRLELRLARGANRLRFSSDHRVAGQAGDARELAFRLTTAELGTGEAPDPRL